VSKKENKPLTFPNVADFQHSSTSNSTGNFVKSLLNVPPHLKHYLVKYVFKNSPCWKTKKQTAI